MGNIRGLYRFRPPREHHVYTVAKLIRTILIWGFFAYGVNASDELHNALPLILWSIWAVTLAVSLLRPKAGAVPD